MSPAPTYFFASCVKCGAAFHSLTKFKQHKETCSTGMKICRKCGKRLRWISAPYIQPFVVHAKTSKVKCEPKRRPTR